MAFRPVFVVLEGGKFLIEERDVSFKWEAGYSTVQKRKNILSLHKAASQLGISDILEISTKSEDLVGRRLSAFSLKISVNGVFYSVESVYQGSKVFENGGPFPEIFSLSPRESRRYIKEKKLGDIVKFNFDGRSFSNYPKNAFYDWLYMKALQNHEKWIRNNLKYKAFTDIEYNPKKQVNCQARAFSEYVSLSKKGLLQMSINDFDFFCTQVERNIIKNSSLI